MKVKTVITLIHEEVNQPAVSGADQAITEKIEEMIAEFGGQWKWRVDSTIKR